MIDNIIDLSKIRSEEYQKLQKRKSDLERLIFACEITYKSLLDIEDIDRFCFTSMINQYKSKWEKELARINAKLGL